MNIQSYRDRIIVTPDIMLGKPIIKGTRITVELILKKLSQDMSFQVLLEAYPNLTKDDILAVLAYSSDVVSQKELIVS